MAWEDSANLTGAISFGILCLFVTMIAKQYVLIDEGWNSSY